MQHESELRGDDQYLLVARNGNRGLKRDGSGIGGKWMDGAGEEEETEIVMRIVGAFVEDGWDGVH